MTIFHTKGGANEQLVLGEALASLSKTMRWVLKYLVLSMFIEASNLWVGNFQTLNLAKVFCDRLPRKLSFSKEIVDMEVGSFQGFPHWSYDFIHSDC